MGLFKNLYRRMRTAFLSPLDARLIDIQQQLRQSQESLAGQAALHARTIETQHGAADAILRQQLHELRTRLDRMEQTLAQHLPQLSAFSTDADAAIALSLREMSRIQDQLLALQQSRRDAAISDGQS